MQKPQTCELPIVSIVLPFLTDHKYEVGKPENERHYNDCNMDYSPESAPNPKPEPWLEQQLAVCTPR